MFLAKNQFLRFGEFTVDCEQRVLRNDSPVPLAVAYTSETGGKRYVFFSSNRTGSIQVWRMNTDGSNQVQITRREGGYPRFITPDGKWVYFESGLHQTLWRVSTEGSDETEVSERKIYGSAFSHDGKFLAYFFRDQSTSARCDVE